MSKKSIRSSIERIQRCINNNSLEIDYDNIFAYYKKNQVSSYTLHLLINSILNKEETDEHVANSREFYTIISSDNNTGLNNELLDKKIELLESKLKKRKQVNNALVFICCVFCFCFVVTLIMLIYTWNL